MLAFPRVSHAETHFMPILPVVMIQLGLPGERVPAAVLTEVGDCQQLVYPCFPLHQRPEAAKTLLQALHKYCPA